MLRPFERERIVSSATAGGTLHHILNSNSKWTKPNVRPKTIKLLKENRTEKLYDIEFSSDFLDMTPKAQVTKVKTRYIELYQN